METYKTIILAFVAYFIGSISFSYIITKRVAGKDIRNLDIKNAGAFNVFLNVGKRIGTLVGVLDGLKTLVIVIIGKLIGLGVVNTIIAASFGIIGHCFPIYHKFYGGRGAAAVIGIFIFFIPVALLISVIPATIIGFLIHRPGTAPAFFIAFSPIVAHIANKSPSLVLAILYVTLLTGIMNLIIILAKREQKVIAK